MIDNVLGDDGMYTSMNARHAREDEDSEVENESEVNFGITTAEPGVHGEGSQDHLEAGDSNQDFGEEEHVSESQQGYTDMSGMNNGDEVRS